MPSLVKKTSIEFVTVEHDNGQVYVGEMVALSDDVVLVLTGFRGRPMTIETCDIVEVLPVSKSNPHVARIR